MKKQDAMRAAMKHFRNCRRCRELVVVEALDDGGLCSTCAEDGPRRELDGFDFFDGPFGDAHDFGDDQ